MRKKSKTRLCNPLVVFSGLALLCGCSSFDRDWTAAGSQPPVPGDITGRWQGTWTSDASKHDGGLRCLITRTGDFTWHARYAATYWNIFHFGYEMDLTGTQQRETTYFTGDADLGWLAGGTYHYNGNATATEFHSTYESAQDHGHFEMKRP